ncbi:MAG: hypothetical protein IKT08_02385 [Bacteroidales bacterium]|nr:hypothetical protein [Bacteroidales bacterium]
MSDRATLSYDNTHIYDSYQIRSKEDMRTFLNNIREHCDPDLAVAVRSMKSLVCEWRSHNFFYYLHVFRSRTKDVDLERKQTWWRECFCRIVSFFYFW